MQKNVDIYLPAYVCIVSLFICIEALLKTGLYLELRPAPFDFCNSLPELTFADSKFCFSTLSCQ